MVPLDISLRDQLGRSLDPAQIDQAGALVRQLLAETNDYGEKIDRLIHELMPNFGHSGEIGGRYILQSLQKKIANRKE